MSTLLQQAGIFKVRTNNWEVYEAQSGAVAISLTFDILEELDTDRTWASWAEFGDHHVYGSWWVIKKDGTVNPGAIDQLVESLGWDGRLTSVAGDPPDKIVQVQVKEEVYEGVTRYKATWMNPEDFAGGSGGGADEASVKALDARFGSLLRAAAGAAKPKPKAKAKKKGPAKKKAGPKGAGADNPAVTGKVPPGDDIPF